MRRMRSILAVALLASAAPMIFAADALNTAAIDETATAVNAAAGDSIAAVNHAVDDATAAVTKAAAELPEVDVPEAVDLDGALDTLKATADTAALDELAKDIPVGTVVISLTPGGQPGCYTIGEVGKELAEFCKDPAAAVQKANPIDGVDYEWVTGTLKNIGGADLCQFSSEPLKLEPALLDMLKLPAGEAAEPFEHLILPDTKLQVIKLPNEQVLHAQLMLPVDVSKITASAPMTGVPGATLAANIQPCAVLDSLQEPKLVEGFTASLNKLAGTAAAAPEEAAADAKAAATDAATDATTQVAEAAVGAVDTITKAAAQAEAKVQEALEPQAQDGDVATEAISPANSLTASIAGLAAVAAALAFQFVL